MNESEWVRFLSELFGPDAPRAVSGPTLVVGAHPDDETIGASWVLTHAAEPRVLQVTDGAPRDARLWPNRFAEAAVTCASKREEYAALRRRESEQALACLKLPAACISQLGFVDQDVPHQLARVVSELARVLVGVSPQAVITHPFEGGHPDHDATSIAVRAAISQVWPTRTGRPLLIEMSSYHLHDGQMRTGRFLPHDSLETVRVLSAEEQANKARMFAAYDSQREVLSAFRCGEERYRRAGRLVLDRFSDAELLYPTLGFTLRSESFRALVSDALRALSIDEEALS